MLEVRNVNHHYGAVQVLHDLSFTVNRGEVLGFLGPNGAGKSTTMRILTGYLTPTSGQVLFDGLDARRNMVALRARLGYLPENVPLYPELRVAEYLRWVARVKRSADPERQVAEAMDRCGLAHVAARLIRHLSRGYRQRVGLAQAMLGNAELLILDEPTVGLDPAQIREIRELIRELGRERTILLSTHILAEVELACDRVLIIDKGCIKAEDTPSNLAAGAGALRLRVGVAADLADAVCAALAVVPGVREARPESGGGSGDGVLVRVEAEPGADVRARLAERVLAAGWPLLELRPAGDSLEEAFVSLVTGQGGHAPDAASAVAPDAATAAAADPAAERTAEEAAR
ncbi:MAG: ABC transporter ATP-binding protein [Desulfovibrionaceae bacterium]|jgi:ABC-2 type transport system ATP-binding protein|nr:ABC transporter ATP-binding protein [Desulfovibrionaceae bacterium]